MLAGMVTDQIAQNNPGAPAMRAIQMFDTAWVAVPAIILGLAFMMICGKWLLPSEKSEEEHIFHEKRHYRVGFTVEEQGRLVGQTLQNVGFTSSGGCELMRMSLDRGVHETPITPDYVMRGGELLTFSCDIDHLPDLWAIIGLLPYNTIVKMESERYTIPWWKQWSRRVETWSVAGFPSCLYPKALTGYGWWRFHAMEKHPMSVSRKPLLRPRTIS
jgi:hypothetical protein